MDDNEKNGVGMVRMMAEQLGYQSEAAFNRAFKSFTCETPGAVRRAARKVARPGPVSSDDPTTRNRLKVSAVQK